MKTWYVVSVMTLVLSGCAGTGNRPPPVAAAPETQAVAPSAALPETVPTDVPLPPLVIGEGGITPPNVIMSSWNPVLTVSPPPHWEVVQHEDLKFGEYGRVVSSRHNASISFVTHPAKERAVDEAVMIMVDMLKRGFRVTKGINGDADPNRMAFGWCHHESKTCGYVIVRHYGADGRVSFVFTGTWPSTLTSRQDGHMHRMLETFVNDTQLLSQ